nr:MAG TPA: hypothetical protein [Caudoviricetes sp.]
MNVLSRRFPTVEHCCVCVQHQHRCGAIWRAAIAYIRVVTGACYQNSG